MNRRDAHAARRFAERRKLEDEAPRLTALFPSLRRLRLEIKELRAGARVAESTHVREIVVARAPALFFLPCREPTCIEGGHDLTPAILRALRAGDTRFEGVDECMGDTKFRTCGRLLRYSGLAEYETPVVFR